MEHWLNALIFCTRSVVRTSANIEDAELPTIVNG